MIYNYPYFGFPNYTKYMAQTYPYNYYNSNFNRPNNSIYNNQFNNNSNNLQNSNSYNGRINKSNNAPLFTLFGIQLYFDDILLICIILFLYNEKIEDNYLLIALVLLLLS